MERLKPGIYELRKVVSNPAKDRRSKDWFRNSEFPLGIYIVRPYLAQRHGGDESDPIEIVLHGQRWGIKEPDAWMRDPESGYQKDAASWDALAGALEPAPEHLNVYTLMQLNKIEGYNADDILFQLVKDGKLTYDDILDAYHKWYHELPE